MLLDQTEAARLLGLHPRSLSNWRLRRTGPAWVRVGRRAIRYRPSAIAAWLDKNTVAGQA
ncbi:MAG TPA: hypothetical protein DCS97_00095 [Planctomycetes bacterium]|nr:hypothetical protein [Planctomycetota bacterium]